MRPTIYVSGRTGAGKSSLARGLAEHFGLNVLSASARLVSAMDDSGRSRADRLRSWLVRENHIRRNAAFDRDTDFRLLHQIDAAPAGLIVDSGYLSLLLAPVNSALTVWVDASLPVRAARLAAIVPDVDAAGRRLIVERKDVGTATAIRSAWGLEAAREDLWELRHDLVLRCPEPEECSDPADCARALREIGEHAVDVYLTYCRDDGADGSPRDDVEEKAAALQTVCERRKAWVQVISSALLAPEAGATPEQWRRRTSAD